jgi:predicted murein hydrolase (TIGR00659 family)
MTPAFDLWVYLASTPLLWLTVTLLVWIVSDRIARASGQHPLVNPVLLSIVALGAILIFTGTSFATYFQGAQFVHFLLGPAIVAIAVPLYRNLDKVRENLLPMIAALVAGSVTAVVAALAIASSFGLPDPVLAALAPKSVTAGVAMGIAEQFGGEAALTAVLVVTTGLLGAIMVTPLMNILGLKDYAARGFAAGLAAHGIGTARAFVVDEVAGTFAGIAMALNAVLTALILPFILYWFLA